MCYAPTGQKVRVLGLTALGEVSIGIPARSTPGRCGAVYHGTSLGPGVETGPFIQPGAWPASGFV